jgi:hypothetical protein
MMGQTTNFYMLYSNSNIDIIYRNDIYNVPILKGIISLAIRTSTIFTRLVKIIFSPPAWELLSLMAAAMK